MKPIKRLCLILLAVLAILNASTPFAADKKVISYYTNWAQYRQGDRKFFPSNIDAKLYTHIVYGFADILYNEVNNKPALTPSNSYNFRLVPFEWNDVKEWTVGVDWTTPQGYYFDVINKKQENPNLKVLISVGGWNFNDPNYTDYVSHHGLSPAWIFTTICSTPENRADFIRNVITFCRTYGFDGIDIDWEYTGISGRNSMLDSNGNLVPSTFNDRVNYPLLIQEMRQAFHQEALQTNRPELVLSIAVAAGQGNTAGYDFDNISPYVDWIGLMTYDYHGGFDAKTGATAPLYKDSDPNGQFSFADTVSHYRNVLGVPADKLVLGFGAYGRGWSGVASPTFNISSSGSSPAGPFTQSAGYLAYYEIEDYIKNHGYVRYFDDATGTPFIYNSTDRVLVSYDDQESFNKKVDFLLQNNLAGAMTWAMDLDSFLPSDTTQNALQKVLYDRLLAGVTPNQTTVTTNYYPDTWTTLSPKKLLVYYGWPSAINGTFSTANASAVFQNYHYAVLGAGLEDPSHGDHLNTQQIIVGTPSTKFFGYIDLGVSPGSNWSTSNIAAKVDAWKSMGIYGIFLDDFGYDFGVTRQRQNEVVDYIHNQGLCVVANAWVPDDVFGNTVNGSNPTGTASKLNATDYYLFESFQIKEGGYQSQSEFVTKMDSLNAYRNTVTSFNILAVTTAAPANTFSQSQFDYAWYTAAINSVRGLGWGEYDFSANSAQAPLRARPTPTLGNTFTSAAQLSGPTQNRTTELGTLSINFNTHIGSFSTPNAAVEVVSANANIITMGYVENLRTGGTSAISKLNYDSIDYIVHGFVRPEANGSLSETTNFATYRQAGLATTTHQHGKKIIMSIGGALDSTYFSTIAASTALRATFVGNVVTALQSWGYDGVDIDWEFPESESDKQNFTLLMQALYTAVKQANPNHVVMFGASPADKLAMVDWAQIKFYTDYAFYFGYDWKNPANGPLQKGPLNNPPQQWIAPYTEHIDASVSGALNYILSKGFPESKLIMGIPFYGSDNSSWSSIRSTYIAQKSQLSVDPFYAEVLINNVWWNTPEAITVKMNKVLLPASSVLAGGKVIRGVGWWEFGHEDPDFADLSSAVLSWKQGHPPTIPVLPNYNTFFWME
ncbi:MAG: glycosyl hydrolase family 18 protein [Candidatus Margulisiibacteriota bacterium]